MKKDLTPEQLHQEKVLSDFLATEEMKEYVHEMILTGQKNQIFS